MSFELVSAGELVLGRCTALMSPHAFSTRTGGVSGSPFQSLNMGMVAGDEPELVRANRARFVAAAGFARPIATGHQVHGAAVHEAPVPAGAQGDVVICRTPGAPVGVYVADCVPILLEDRRTGAVAAIHAGWRGTAAGAVPAALRAMHERYGTRSGDCVAAIGPSILACCYQVGPEVVAAMQALPEPARVIRGGADWRVDLQEANRQWLAAAGVGTIAVSGWCTSCMAEVFFSYRREGERSGRMLAAIARPGA